MPSLLVTLLLLLLSLPLHAQKNASKKKGERTVFWEISGNGLERPSYLFGTIHIHDKRAFDFTDSVLLRFDECSIFASELMIDSAVRETFQRIAAEQSVLTEGLEEEVKGIEEKLEDAIEGHGESDGNEEGDEGIVHEEIVVATPSDEDAAGEGRDTSASDESVEVESVEVEEPDLGGPVSIAVPSDEEYEADIEPSRERPSFGEPWHRNPFFADFFEEEDTLKPGDKPTMLDAYLFGLARRDGKELVGLETVQEQIDAFTSFNMLDLRKESLRRKKWQKKMEENPEEFLLDYYTRGDLEQLRSFFEDNLSDRALRRFLWERNHRMVERAIPSMRKGSTFIAVGAGHLPGEEGMIELFRAKGFTVRPVGATRTGLAALYKPSSQPEKWHTLYAGSGAFSVDMPLEPMIFPGETSGFYMFGRKAAKKIFLWPDLGTGVFYMASYIDYLDNVHRWKIDVLLRLMGNAELGEELTPIGFPKKLAIGGMQGRELEAKGSDNRHHRLRIYLRGNRLYALRAISTAEMIHGADVERFFNSFAITEYDSIRWSRFVASDQGYTIEVPGEPMISTDSGWSFLGSTFGNLMAGDSTRGEYYSVRTERFGEFFMIEDEEKLYENIVNDRAVWNDTLVRMIPVEHDGVAGRELLIGAKGDTFPSLRVRVFVRGGRLYTITPHVSRDRLYSSDVERFFSSFDFIGAPAPGDIYADKVESLIDAIASTDGRRREKALRAAGAYPFRSEHLPKLYEMISRSYHSGPEQSDEIRLALLRPLSVIGDSTTVSFLEEIYSYQSESEGERVAILTTLAAIGTREALELLLDLTLKEQGGESEEKPRYSPFTHLGRDVRSLRPLYPRILPLLSRKEHGKQVARLTIAAIDSGLIDAAVLAPYESTMIATIEENLTRMEDDAKVMWERSFTIQWFTKLLGRMSASPKSDAVLTRLERHENEDIAIDAMMALVRRGKMIRVDRMKKLAADPGYRIRIYRNLESIGRLDLFPKEYATQRHIAEGLLSEWLDAEMGTPDLIELVAEREMTVKGEPMRIYLFKFAYSGGPERWDVGYVGSQPLDRSKINSDPLLIGASYNELSSMSLDEHIEDLIEE